MYARALRLRINSGRRYAALCLLPNKAKQSSAHHVSFSAICITRGFHQFRVPNPFSGIIEPK